MIMLKRVAPVVLLGVSLPFVTGLDQCLGLCDYETDPNCEDPLRAQIEGTIQVPEAGGEAVGFTRISGPVADALKDAMVEQLNRPQPEGTPVKVRTPRQSRSNQVEKAKTTTERFRPGEIIVRAVDPIRERKAEIAAAIEMHLEQKLDDVVVDVRLCGTEYRCVADVKWATGKLLELHETADAVAVLGDAPFLKYAEKNLILQMTAQPNDEFFTLQWHYAAIDLPTAWDTTIGSPDVVAAVIDTGILLGHEDLDGRVTGGADLIDDEGVANDGNGRDDDGDDAGDNACGDGCHSHHGSHVAGTMGAETDNGTMVAGVTWEGDLLAVRVLGVGGGSLADIADGILWSVGEDVEGVSRNPTPADVINMSLGGQGESQAMNEAIDSAVATGCIVVVAAGNDDIDASNFTPANAPASITVASHGNTAAGTPSKASYSNFGDKVDFAAPGGEQAQDLDNDGQGDGVLSTVEDFVTFYQGTSMAAPHVAGIAMLLKSVDSTIDQEDARTILASSASDDLDCPQGCGAGRVSAAAALFAAQGDLDGPRVIATPSFLRVGLGQTQTPVVLKNIGSDAADVTIDIGGENRDLCDVDTSGLTLGPGDQESRIVNIQRNAEADDRGECTIIATFGAGESTEARVVWTPDQIEALTTVDVGAVRVDGGEIRVARIVTTTEIEQFRYKLFNLDPGTYIVIGLVDVNANGSYDDAEDGVGIFVPPDDGDDDACTEAACGEVTVGEGDKVTGADFLVAPGFEGDDGTGGTGDGVLGDPCGSSEECGGGLYCEDQLLTDGYCTATCVDDDDCAGGICVTLVDVDDSQYEICLESCTDDSDCDRPGYFCDPADNTCFPGP